MMITSEQVLAALRHVEDPDLKKDLVTLGMIKDIATNGLKVTFTVVLTTPACPLKEKIKQDCIDAVHKYIHPGAVVEPLMTSNVTSVSKQDRLPNVRNIIVVASGKGGVGKSTVAANLAVALAQTGARVALCDGDISGPSVAIMFGLEGKPPFFETIEGRDIMMPTEVHGVKVNSTGMLVRRERPLVMRGPMAGKTLNQLIFDSNWGEIDYFIFDTPPGTGDIHLTLVQQLPITGVVLVTTPQQVALSDARKGAEMFRDEKVNVPILGIVENMAFFVPSDLPDRKYFLFGKDGGQRLANDLNVPLLAQIPIVESVGEGGDSGSPIALDRESVTGKAFAALAAEVARQVAIRNSTMPPTVQVQMQH
jgi:ATP-binding protein involved in chromosome partitioning